MRLPWIASSRTDKQVAGDFLVPSFSKKWSSLTRSHNISADRFLIKYDDAFRMRNLKETSTEDFGISSRERRENSSRVLYIYFTARFESNCASDLVSSSTILTAKTRGLGGSHRLGGDLVARVSRKESLETRGLKRSLLLQVGFFQMTTRDRRERGKFWPGFRGHLDAYIRHRSSRKSSFRCRATCLFEPRYPLDAPLLSCFRISRHSKLPSLYAHAAWTPRC